MPRELRRFADGLKSDYTAVRAALTLPRSKGKVERGVDYVQSNALKGRAFTSLAAQNRYLLDWETSVADTRIHGTTRQQIKRAFQEREKPALLPLPIERFPCFQEARRKVHRDGHVEVDKAYYSVPPEYVGRSVWVRWDSRLVPIFNGRFEQIAIHARHEPGRFRTADQHIPQKKRSGIERGAAYLLNKANLIRPHAGQWAAQVIHQRGIEAVRVLMGLLSLANRHPGDPRPAGVPGARAGPRRRRWSLQRQVQPGCAHVPDAGRAITVLGAK